MSEIVEKVRLIYADVEANNNKFWEGVLYDNDDVETRWGRVGKSAQSKSFPSKGRSYLMQKKKEKERKGYTEQKTMEAGQSVVSSNINLKDVAKKQIRIDNPTLSDLVDRLIKYNIHKITHSTNIEFDSNSGMFTTPLGIVTQEGIDEGRQLLVDIKDGLQSKDRAFISAVNKYLRIVPQDAGMKLNIDRLFPDEAAVINQSDILDSLESSLKALHENAKDAPVDHPKVFDVDLKIVTNQNEIDRINKKFANTRKGMHRTNNFRLHRVYSITIANSLKEFESKGKPYGNIMELWHGTKCSNVLSILRRGLVIPPTTSGHVTGRMYGNGLYFSDVSTKSLNYATNFWGNGGSTHSTFMFLADVAMGKPHHPRGSFRGDTAPAGYDSVYAKAGMSGVINNEMIVYRLCQHNLKYLCEFK